MQGVLSPRDKSGRGEGWGSIDQWGLNQGEVGHRGYKVEGMQRFPGYQVKWMQRFMGSYNQYFVCIYNKNTQCNKTK